MGPPADDVGCAAGALRSDRLARDISVTGCAAMGQRPIAACEADYDLAHVEGERLTFGARPADNDLCTPAKRPVALSKSSTMRN